MTSKIRSGAKTRLAERKFRHRTRAQRFCEGGRYFGILFGSIASSAGVSCSRAEVAFCWTWARSENEAVPYRSVNAVMSTPPEVRKVKCNVVRCKRCEDLIESRSTDDFVKCSCGACAVDGGLEYLRRLGSPDDWEELSEL
jgi:hypothetical protein